MRFYRPVVAILLLFIAACSSTQSSSSPSPVPITMPTTVEYIGEKVNSQIVAKWGEAMPFEADADASDVIVTFTDMVTGEAITDDSYGTVVKDGKNITITVPDTWLPNALSGANIRFTLPDGQNITSTEGGVEGVRVTPDPEKSEEMVFDSMLFYADASDPDIYVYGDSLYACFRSLESTRSIYFAKSDYDGANMTVSRALFTGSSYYNCSVGANDDLIVMMAMYLGDRSDPLGPLYNVFKYSTDGGSTFSDQIDINSNVLVNSRSEFVIDENDVIHVVDSIQDSKEIRACTTTSRPASCGSAFAIAEGTADNATRSGADSLVRIVNAGGGILYVVFLDVRDSITYPDVRLVKLSYDGSSYRQLGDYKISSAVDLGMFTWAPNIGLDMDGNIIVTWTYIYETGCGNGMICTELDMAEFNVQTAAVGGATAISDISDSLLPVVPAVFIDLSNNLHVLYSYWGTPDGIGGFAGGGSRYAIGSSDDGLRPSKDIEIENFNYLQTRIRYGTSEIGRAYIIDDTPTHSGGQLVASDIYLIMGTKP